jgi:hypothetical protein
MGVCVCAHDYSGWWCGHLGALTFNLSEFGLDELLLLSEVVHALLPLKVLFANTLDALAALAWHNAEFESVMHG